MRTTPFEYGIRSLSVLVLASSLLACGASTKDIVQLDPLEFRARNGQAGVTVDTIDPDVLFKEAARLYSEQKFAESVEKYDVYLELFADEPAAPLAAFNAGLGLEALSRWSDALARYEVALAGVKKESDRVDVLFRIGACQEKLEQWSEMEKTFEQVIALKLTVIDRAEAWTKRGFALQKLGDLTQAERAYKECLKIYNDNIHLRLFDGNYFVSMAQFQLGEIYRTLFDSITFRLPVERMQRDLDDKSNLFLKAQHAYLRTVRLHSSQWAVAAGFRLGAMYEDFYQDMLQAEYPAELDDQEVALYFEELRKNILPLVQRAVEIYERNLAMSERAGASNDEWTVRTEKHLTHLRGLLEEEERRLEAERRAEEGGPSEPPTAELSPAN